MTSSSPSFVTFSAATQRARRLMTLLATCGLMMGALACAPAASQPVKCASMSASTGRATNWNAEYGLEIKPDRAQMSARKSVSDNQWFVTPGFTIATQAWANRVMCYQTMNAPVPLYLKVVPSETYLQALKATGLDLRIRSTVDAPSDELMLIRDGVAPVQGRFLELKQFRSIQWDDSEPMFYWSPGKEPGTRHHVPWLNISLEFVVVESRDGTTDAHRTVVIPKGSDLSLKVMAAGHEATGLEIFPVADPIAISFGACAPPVILVNNMSTSVATIDLGTVPLDMLRQNQRIETSFSVTVRPRPRASNECKSSRGNKGPALRFVATGGRFSNGRFHGEPDNPAYPGNSVVAVEILDGSKALGANQGDSDLSSQVKFTSATDYTKTFNASVKYRTDTTERLGPFLIPVTLEAYYN